MVFSKHLLSRMRSKTVATSNDKGSTQAKRKQAVQSPPKKRQRISVVVAADRHSSEESIEKKGNEEITHLASPDGTKQNPNNKISSDEQMTAAVDKWVNHHPLDINNKPMSKRMFCRVHNISISTFNRHCNKNAANAKQKEHREQNKKTLNAKRREYREQNNKTLNAKQKEYREQKRVAKMVKSKGFIDDEKEWLLTPRFALDEASTANDGTLRNTRGQHYLGLMNEQCGFCGALGFQSEVKGSEMNQQYPGREKVKHLGSLCCISGKVKGICDYNLPKALEVLYTSSSKVAIDFRKDARTYNNGMAMSSVTAT